MNQARTSDTLIPASGGGTITVDVLSPSAITVKAGIAALIEVFSVITVSLAVCVYTLTVRVLRIGALCGHER